MSGNSTNAAPSLWSDRPDWTRDGCRHTAWLRAQGLDVDPYAFDPTKRGAESYARAHGAMHFSGAEICTPRDSALWLRLYPQSACDAITRIPVALPARCYWPRWIAPLVLAQELRELIDEPIHLAHGWRPPEYNRAVRGEPGSDHLSACAWDLDVESARAAELCRKRLAELYVGGRLGLSIGWHSGPRKRFHVGVLAPATVARGRQRDWDYDREGKSWLIDWYRSHR